METITKGTRFIARRVVENGDNALATITSVDYAADVVKWVTDGGRSFRTPMAKLRKQEVKQFI